MKNEIMISGRGSGFETELLKAVGKAQKTQNLLDNLIAMGQNENVTVLAMIDAQQKKFVREISYILGLMKANVDSMSDELAAKQEMNGIPLNMLIKMKVDQEVLQKRDKNYRVYDYTLSEPGTFSRYENLSMAIAGYGYNQYLLQDRFEGYFPNESHLYVTGFATGYSEGLHAIAAGAGIEMVKTDVLRQDIWKNVDFFDLPGCMKYSLEGIYFFDGQGTKYSKELNIGLYDRLKGRLLTEFVSTELALRF